jgi:Txe/YoeB family toxin of toxin-antitoxin system
MYKITLKKRAEKDSKKIDSNPALKKKVREIIKTIRENPYEESQGFERLKYDLKGMCSREVTQRDRFLYKVFPNTDNLKNSDGRFYDGIVDVASMLSHYYDK